MCILEMPPCRYVRSCEVPLGDREGLEVPTCIDWNWIDRPKAEVKTIKKDSVASGVF
jgi:hypothetical protein